MFGGSKFGFIHKTNPFNQARAPGAKVWKKNEGLSVGCTSKGKKAGRGYTFHGVYFIWKGSLFLQAV